ncbi:hypothetical protein AB2L28_08660 [Kineococcus sp. TBRC 1896]|uniref:ATP/GTP-binding protein n=1 Tax=Kineococcus mangrovi TaxID=1660183 RepID=A0ABV4I0V6_9ACTN
MPRANRRRPDPPPRAPLGRGVDRTVSGPDGTWVVRELRGTSSEKTYRCPGCHQDIPPGTPHLVVWPARGTFSPGEGVTERRHWHRSCFTARGRRF